MKKIIILCLSLSVLLCACKRNMPSAKTGLPKQYSTAYQQIYGHCYDSVPFAVVSLDLYTDSLHLDRDNRIQGTGHNLCITDIFVPDSLLEKGVYTSIPQDSLSRFDFRHAAYRFLPGKSYEDYPHGLYVLTIEDSKVTGIQVLDSGSYAFRHDSLLFTFYYRDAYNATATYTCHFHGPLIPWLKE